MANEKKDGLFGVNLMDNLIDIPDNKEEQGGGTPETGKRKPAEEKKPEQLADGVIVNEDGSFEIDTFASTEKENSSKEENEDTLIEKSEKIEGKGKAPSKGGQSDSSPSSSPYLAFAKDRANEGVFLNFTDEQWQQLVERNEGDEAQALRELHEISMSTMIQKNVDKYKESLTPEERNLYEAKEKGVPVDKYAIAKKNYDKYSKITADQLKDNEALQVEVVTRALELRGYAPDEIKEEIEGYKALESLGVKATKALEVVPKAFQKQVSDLEAAATAEEESKKNRIAQRVAKMKGLIDNTPEIIPGIKLTKSAREQLVESMTVPVARDDEGNPLNRVMATRVKNPEAFEMLIHYYHALGLFNLDENGNMKPDFSKIAKIEKTKAVDGMRQIFESQEKQTSSKSKVIKTDDDNMDEFDKAFRRLGR